MKIILFGANGTIGREVFKELQKDPDHNIITVARTSGDYKIDISDSNQLRLLFTSIKNFDALICIAGYAHFGPFSQTSEEDIYFGIKNKMMGQINMVMIGKEFINDNGSFTLTSGFLSDDPIKGGMNYSMVNGAIEGFVKSASIELDRGIRLNVVSPGNVISSAIQQI